MTTLLLLIYMLVTREPLDYKLELKMQRCVQIRSSTCV
eukprot:COSAG05_NODE_277_length_12336_cov_419.763668_12_plen_38_part_00